MASVLFKFGTQTQYDTLASGAGYDTNSLYFIEDTNRLYKGSVLMSEQAIFTTTVPEFASAKAERIYVVTSGDSVSMYVKGSTQMVQAGGGTVQPGAITNIDVFNESVLTTTSEVSGGVLPDNDTTIPTSGAVKDAIDSAVAGLETKIDGTIVNVTAARSEDNSGTVLKFQKEDGSFLPDVTVADLFLTSASYDSVSHKLTLVVQGGDSVEVDLGELIPQAVNTEDVAIAQPITMTVNVGNFTAGTELITSGEPTENQILVTDMQDLLEKMFSQDINPTTTQPSANITLNGAGGKEVGTQFTPSYTASLNAGAYKISYGQGQTKTQPTEVTATSYAVTDTNSGSASTATGSFTQFTVQDDTNYSVSVTIQHTAGAIPLTFLGNEYPAGQIQAGSKTKQSGTVTGFRKGFYGAVSSKDAAIDSAFVRGLSTSTNSAPANGNTWIIQIPVGTLRVAFAYPATLRDVTTVVDAATKYDVKTAFTQSTVSVEGANNYSGINYKVYVTDFANPTDSANTYTVTI